MIVELFGPQGAGKTTFAQALAARLRKQDQNVDLILSYRPSERTQPDLPIDDPAHHRASALASRLTRPIIELLAMTLHPFVYSCDVNMASNLLKALPPRSLLSSAKLSQYILRLSSSWRRASASDHIALFDQAFVQAVCSLMLFSSMIDETRTARALDAIPKPDLLIQLDAPRPTLDARLRDRQRLQSPIERMLDFIPTDIGEQQIFAQLQALLERRGQAVTSVSSSDSHSLADAVNRVAEQITARIDTRQQTHRMVPDDLPGERYRHV